MNGVKRQVQAVGCLQRNRRKGIRLLLEGEWHVLSVSPSPEWLHVIEIVRRLLALRSVKPVPERMKGPLRFPKEQYMETQMNRFVLVFARFDSQRGNPVFRVGRPPRSHNKIWERFKFSLGPNLSEQLRLECTQRLGSHQLKVLCAQFRNDISAPVLESQAPQPTRPDGGDLDY